MRDGIVMEDIFWSLVLGSPSLNVLARQKKVLGIENLGIL